MASRTKCAPALHRSHDLFESQGDETRALGPGCAGGNVLALLPRPHSALLRVPPWDAPQAAAQTLIYIVKRPSWHLRYLAPTATASWAARDGPTGADHETSPGPGLPKTRSTP